MQGKTHRKSHNDQVAGNMEGRVCPPQVNRLAVYRCRKVQRPVPERFQRDARGADGHDEPDPDGDDENHHNLDRLLDPAVCEDAFVEQENRDPRQRQADIIKEDAVPRRLQSLVSDFKVEKHPS